MTKHHQIIGRARPVPSRSSALTSTGSVEALAELLGIASTSTRLPVTERTVHGLPAAWSALNKVSNAVAQMMVGAEAFGPDGRTPLAVVPTVLDTPSPELDSFTYWKTVVTTAMCRGNCIGINLDYDTAGYPRLVQLVPADAVDGYYDADGFAVYEIGGEQYRPDEITHVRIGVTVPGQVMTIGVIEAHRRGLSAMLDQQGMAASVWREGATPTGVVQLDTKYPTADQIAITKAGWVSMLEGKRTVAVTGTSMGYTPVTWSADDAQFLESRQFSVAECALMFGLKPEDLGSSFGSSTALSYGNRTDDALERITESYAPVMIPIEQAWSRLIPGRNFVRGNPEALLRASTAQRYEIHKLAQEIGIETQDETRALEGKPKAAPVSDPTQQSSAPADSPATDPNTGGAQP